MKNNTNNQEQQYSCGITETYPHTTVLQFYCLDTHIGTLNFTGSYMTFSGDADESARVFFEGVAGYFSRRLQREREYVVDHIITTCREHAQDMSELSEVVDEVLTPEQMKFLKMGISMAAKAIVEALETSRTALVTEHGANDYNETDTNDEEHD